MESLIELANGGHGHGGGTNTEMLLSSVAMLVLGAVFFVQKTVKTPVAAAFVIAGLIFGVGAFTFGS